jgi:hypothetical protein
LGEVWSSAGKVPLVATFDEPVKDGRPTIRVPAGVRDRVGVVNKRGDTIVVKIGRVIELLDDGSRRCLLG